MKYLFLIIFISCSSIEFVSGGINIKDPPNIPFQSKVENTRDENDCRKNKDFDSKTIFFLNTINFPEELSSEWINNYFNFLSKFYNSKDSKIIFSPSSISETDYINLCKEKEIDLVIESEVNIVKNVININQIFKDSYNKYIYGNILFHIKKGLSQSQNKNITEFYYSNGNLYNIPKYESSNLEFTNTPDFEKVKKIINKNKLGYISVYSSEIDVDVYVDSEKIGSIPIKNKSVKVGNRKISFKKKNSVLTRDKEIYVRSGVYQNILDPYISSYNPTSLYLFSEPRNLPIYRESIKIGSTPLLLNNINPGEIFISINSPKSQNLMIKPGMTNILVRPENSSNALEKSILWDLNNIGELQVDFNNGLGFINNSGEYITNWSGLHTQILSNGTIEIIAELFPPEELKESEIILGTFGDGVGPSVSIEGDKFSVFDFRLNNRDIKTFKILNPETTSRILRFIVYPNKIKIYFNNEKFFETDYILKNDWRFFISCKGAIFNRINVLKKLSFKYL